MHNYQGTQTEINLATAFAGESQARNNYTYFAAVARREGHEELAKALEAAAENEKEHARIWLAELGGIKGTIANLEQTVKNEAEEAKNMYPNFAEQARKDGFEGTAALFERVGAIEAHHLEIMTNFLNQLRQKPVAAVAPKAPLPAAKRFHECHFCGNIEVSAPDAPCSLCKHEHAFTK